MSANDVEPGPASIPPGATQPATSSRPHAGALWHDVFESAWRGAKAGFRRASYVAGPVAVVILIPGLVVSAFAAGTGRGLPLVPRQIGPVFGYGPFFVGWGLPPLLLNPIRLYFGSALLGVILGLGIGVIRGMVRRFVPAKRTPEWWAALTRPRHLFRRRQSTAIPAGFAPSRQRRRRLWPWLVGGPLFLLLALAFGTGVNIGRMVNHRLAAAIAAADRDDPYWRLDDLMAQRDVVPDAENSALVVAEALAHLPENWPAGPAAQPGTQSPPPTKAEQAFDELAIAANVRIGDAAAATLRGELETYDEAVRLARTVAEYDRGRHELVIGPTLLDTLLPEAQAARSAARLLSADAAMRAHDGDLDGALDSCRAILGVGRSIGDEPFLISQLVRIAIGNVALSASHRVLGQGQPSDTALERLQALVLDEQAQPLLVHAMRGERAVSTELIRRVGAGELPIAALSDGAAALDPARPGTIIAPWGRLMFEYQRAVALEWLNDAVAIARRPSTAQPSLWDAWDARVDRVRKTWHGPFTTTLPILLFPALSVNGPAHLRYQSALGASAILLAAERQRRRTGQWPATIAAIDPDILPHPPLDPFSGQAFHMEQRDGQLVIYSIGPNRKDEHGAFEQRRWLQGGFDDVGARAWDVTLRRQPPSTDPDGAAGDGQRDRLR